MSKPRNVVAVAAKIIGVAGVSGLAKADIYLVEGKAVRALMTAYEGYETASVPPLWKQIQEPAPVPA